MPETSTKYFGSVEYGEHDVLLFPSGLPAFEDETEFLLMEPPANAPLVFLQSLKQPGLCFLTLPIQTVDPDYHLDIAPEDLPVLGFDSAEALRVSEPLTCLAVLTVAENGDITANLLAPVVIHRKRQRGVQAVRIDSAYSHNHPLTAPAGAPREEICS
ncbi:MAG TPA: flagellar assembly protein FliW [Bryobacteraceae bacterium]|jgi:flagellar assembly factor FliW|nr:flagellar assembly protein FliW [Bryobacteraceae bacterium]